MSDGLTPVTVVKTHVVIVEQLGLPVPPFVFEFQTPEIARDMAKAWFEADAIEYTGPGMPPNHESIFQIVRLRAPFRILAMSKSEHTAQMREIRAAQMQQQALARPQLVQR